MLNHINALCLVKQWQLEGTNSGCFSNRKTTPDNFRQLEKITHDSSSRLYRPGPFSQLGFSEVVRGLLLVIDRFRPRSTHRGAKMRRDYVGLASIFLRLAMAPDTVLESSDIGCQDQAGRNAIKTITGRILRSDDLLFLAEEGSIRTYMLADASRLRAYEGKKVRISGALESPHVIVVRTIDAVD